MQRDKTGISMMIMLRIRMMIARAAVAGREEDEERNA